MSTLGSGIFETAPEDPKAKKRRYLVMLIALIVVGSLGGYWMYFDFLHVPEQNAAEHFFNAVTAGNLQQAYQLWKADPKHYSYKDFLEDWGDKGYYGPVKSYEIESINSRAENGVSFKVEVCPFTPFPNQSDIEKGRYIKEVRIWVGTQDKALSFAP